VIHDVEKNIGVAVKHLESGEEFSVNGDVYFPMASVFKVPILVEVMALVNEGSLSLEDEVSLQKSDQHMGSGMLSDLDAPGITLSIRNLINLMMKISDNSATDVLLVRVGAENVNARMRQYGIGKITVNRTCQHLIMDFLGMDPNDYPGFSSDQIYTDYRRIREVNPETVEEAKKKFSTILKDQSTPGDMNRLLELIFQKKILNEESCDTIIEVMLECQTGEGRIKGDLPRGTKVAHKTGTLGGTVNDSGIIFLPDGLGHIAITIFTKDIEMDTGDVEEIIAQISRFVYDYFYFTSWSNT
jgi:beta-lactamase class A